MTAGPDDARLPVTILGGFLGSGKTTRLNGLLRDPRGRRVAVVLNELGEVGVDAARLGGAEEFVELDSGCICCALNPDLDVEGVLLTMVDERMNLTQQVMGDIRTHFKDKVFGVTIPRSVRLAEAPSFGKPVLLYDIRSKGAEAYLDLARELMAHGQLPLFAP